MPAPAGPPLQPSAAAALMAQTEPQCTWVVSEGATDAGIFLRPDATDAQRRALSDALSADPLVRNVRFESRQAAYERFNKPDFVSSVNASQLPESFRLKLVPSPRYEAFAATYAGRPGVGDLTQLTLARMYASWARIWRTVDLEAYSRRVLMNAVFDQRERRSSGEVVSADLPDRSGHARR